jgi:TPR repeat protein
MILTFADRDPQMQFYLGVKLYDGDGRQKDLFGAFKWLHKGKLSQIL